MGENAQQVSDTDEASQLVDPNLTASKRSGFRCGAEIRLRYLLSALCCVGFVITYSFRCNVGVATGYFRQKENDSDAAASVSDGPHWSATAIGAVESSYFWGYLVTLIPGGLIAQKLSATKSLGLVLGASSFLHLLLPLAFGTNIGLVIALRVLQGLLEGCVNPLSLDIWHYWAPRSERSTLVALAFSGQNLGVFLGLTVSGVLTDAAGWQSPFFLFGCLGLLWCSLWMLVSSEEPATNSWISAEERALIEESIHEHRETNSWKNFKADSTPWLKMASSMPVLVIALVHFSHGWSLYMLMTESTKFFSDVFDYTMAKSGVYSGLPYLLLAAVQLVSGSAADPLQRHLLSVTTLRKIFICTGYGAAAVFLLALGLTSDAKAATACLTLAVGFSGVGLAGFSVNFLDIAPRYASLLMGVTNTLNAVAGIAVLMLTAHVTKDKARSSWACMFLLAALVNSTAAILYAIFGSGEQQDWVEVPDNEG